MKATKNYILLRPTPQVLLHAAPGTSHQVKWKEGTVDNEHLGRKKSKSEPFQSIKPIVTHVMLQSAASTTSRGPSTSLQTRAGTKRITATSMLTTASTATRNKACDLREISTTSCCAQMVQRSKMAFMCGVFSVLVVLETWHHQGESLRPRQLVLPVCEQYRRSSQASQGNMSQHGTCAGPAV